MSTTNKPARKGQALAVAGIPQRCGVSAKGKERKVCCGGEWLWSGRALAEVNAACDRILARGPRKAVAT
jgi:hypothetical protein